MLRDPLAFLMSTEFECMTTARSGDSLAIEGLLTKLFDRIGRLAPSLHGPSGVFTPYGRVYIDSGHAEFAVCECDSPYELALVIERFQRLAARAIDEMEAAGGSRLLLANNNHSGLLTHDCPVWGSHENYLTEYHPQQFTDLILPFLITRIYGGAGGITSPAGQFVASVRATRMDCAVGGGTTDHRAIHSTAREEHLMGNAPHRFRYHLILGDGHRSQFNVALQFGATALTLKAIMKDSLLRRQLEQLHLTESEPPEVLLKRLNILAQPGEPLQVSPLVVHTQRMYLEAARRYAAGLRSPPTWIARLLTDWEQTLVALERQDWSWLAARLDAFAKHRLYSAVLQEQGLQWRDLPSRPGCLQELALLDHSYHAFSTPHSVFRRLEQAGALEHRVGPYVEAGCEYEPFVIETTTRAKARARLLKEEAGNASLVMDWAGVQDLYSHRQRLLLDPFAAEYAPWESGGYAVPARPRNFADALRGIDRVYSQGDYRRAAQQLHELYRDIEFATPDYRKLYMRLQVWVNARRGIPDSEIWLQRLYLGQCHDLDAINDHCCAIRFSQLRPSGLIDTWIERGKTLLAQLPHSGFTRRAEATFREHAAAILLQRGQARESLEILEPASVPAFLAEACQRVQGRIHATLGEAHRRLGHGLRALRLLRLASREQEAAGAWGDLSDLTCLSLAKFSACRPARARRWIEQAKERQLHTENRWGLSRSLLLEARIAREPDVSERNRGQLLQLRAAAPTLQACPLLTRLLDRWDLWTAGGCEPGSNDTYWGL